MEDCPADNQESIDEYDVLIEGTTLMHAILAAALSCAGLKVIHLDENEFYGRFDACIAPPFDLTGLDHYIEDFRITSGTASASLSAARDYNMELSPRLLYAGSNMISVLRDIGLGDYIQFKALKAFYLYKHGSMTKVPSTKEDIFTSTSMPLITKRRLMKFIKYCLEGTATDIDQKANLREVMHNHFRLDSDTIDGTCLPLAQALTNDGTVNQGTTSIRQHLRSLGLFGPFPAVIPMYGAGSELTQAFCRKAAVRGATYILGQKNESPLLADHVIKLASGHQVKARRVVTDRRLSDDRTLTRRTLIVMDNFDHLMNGGDGTCVSFAPDTEGGQIVQCQIHGPGTGACPEGQSIVYLAGIDLTRETLDRVQAELLKDTQIDVIQQLDYDVKASVVWQSYDDELESARLLFETIVDGTKPFLPREEVASDDTVDVF